MKKKQQKTIATFLWLTFGVNPNRELISIEESPRGKTDLRCPYCGDFLTAKKGQIKTWHFAHQTESCRLVERPEIELPRLPCYDRFNLYLSPQELQQLTRLWQSWGQAGQRIPRESGLMKLSLKGFLKCYPSEPPYEFTNQGKIPFGALPLPDFWPFQQSLIQKKLNRFEHQVQMAETLDSPDLDLHRTDLWLYRTQLERVQSQILYFLAITVNGQHLHKIGVTTRTIEQRVQEVTRDLTQHFSAAQIQVVGTWSGRGLVELYFKHRFRDWNYPIGSLTEYFQFGEVKGVLRELEQLSSTCVTILSPKQSCN